MNIETYLQTAVNLAALHVTCASVCAGQHLVSALVANQLYKPVHSDCFIQALTVHPAVHLNNVVLYDLFRGII